MQLFHNILVVNVTFWAKCWLLHQLEWETSLRIYFTKEKKANKHTHNNPNNRILSQDAFHKRKLCVKGAFQQLGHNQIHIALQVHFK